MRKEEIQKLIAETEEELKMAKKGGCMPDVIISLEKEIEYLNSALQSTVLSEKEIEAMHNMREWQGKRVAEKEEIIGLIEKYNLEDIKEGILSRVYGNFDMKVRETYNFNYRENYEIIQLIAFLKSCAGNDVELRSVVSEPMGGDIKGQSKKITLSNNQLLFDFELWLTTILEQKQDGLYQYEFGWEWKNKLLLYDKYNNAIKEHPFYYDKYTTEEVGTILEYEKKQQGNARKLSKNQSLGRVLSDFYLFPLFPEFLEYQPTIQYAFLYDLLSVKGLVPKMEDTTNTEKYDKVKGWIKSYEKIRPQKERSLKDLKGK